MRRAYSQRKNLFILFCIFYVFVCGLFLLLSNSATENYSQTKKKKNDEVYIPPEDVKNIFSFGAYKHVVILAWDGGGTFFGPANTPNCDKIFKNGAVSYHVKTAYPAISGQCWGSMLHGVLPEFHKLTNTAIMTVPYPEDSPYPSVFRVVREAQPDAVLASFCNWKAINDGVIERNLGVVEGSGKDPDVLQQILKYLDENTPTLLFGSFGLVDAAGHTHGYGSKGHLDALNVADDYVGQVYNKLKEKGIADDTLLIVSADHGGSPEGFHAGNTDAERYVFMGIAGKTVDGESSMVDPEVRDVAAITAYALGVDVPETWTGHVPSGVFKNVVAGKRKEVDPPVNENRNHQTVPTPDFKELKAALKKTQDNSISSSGWK